ncbi:MAG: YigZ family protein [Synergistaceae bacterium]|nr:YigZ family protein [Synergistaceae bacterium]
MKNDPASGQEILSYREPAGPASYQEKIQRSLFTGWAGPCHDEIEARELLTRVRAEHRDATHNCWGYLLGPQPVSEYSSDDGEPSGTAGRPILGAVHRSGILNVIVIVTRYFGGVKLGVRGLIEAYGGVATRTLDALEIRERVPTRLITVRLPWSAVGVAARLLEDHGGDGMAWDYGEGTIGVSVMARVPVISVEALSQTLERLRAQGTIMSWSLGDAVNSRS